MAIPGLDFSRVANFQPAVRYGVELGVSFVGISVVGSAMKLFRLVYYCVFSFIWFGVCALAIFGGLYNWHPSLITIGSVLAAFGLLVLVGVLGDEKADINRGEYFTSKELLEREETQRQTLSPGSHTRERFRGHYGTIGRISRVVRRAALCGAGIHRIDWAPVDPDTCTQTGRCELCDRPYRRGAHLLGMWTYRKTYTCVQSRPCLRCGQFYGHRIEHVWEKEGFFSEAQCRRCGERAESNTASPG